MSTSVVIFLVPLLLLAALAMRWLTSRLMKRGSAATPDYLGTIVAGASDGSLSNTRVDPGSTLEASAKVHVTPDTSGDVGLEPTPAVQNLEQVATSGEHPGRIMDEHLSSAGHESEPQSEREECVSLPDGRMATPASPSRQGLPRVEESSELETGKSVESGKRSAESCPDNAPADQTKTPSSHAQEIQAVVVEQILNAEGDTGLAATTADSIRQDGSSKPDSDRIPPAGSQHGSSSGSAVPLGPAKVHVGDSAGSPTIGDVGATTVAETGETHRFQGIPFAPSRRLKRKRLSPGKYAPPVLTPGVIRRKPAGGQVTSSNGESNERKLSSAIRVLFERDGWVNLTLLLGRQPDLPEIVDTAWSHQEIGLIALTDKWFQGIVPSEFGRLLKEGVEIEATTGDGKRLIWTLSGRSLYVLAPSNSLSGFISTTRLVLGEKQVVLATQDLLASVLAVIAETGSPTPEVLGASEGVPQGWMCLRRVVPQKPIPQADSEDILNLLRPLPNVEIALYDGIRIGTSTWLAGYPPKIHFYGDLTTADHVFIDGKEASCGMDGSYTAPGWDIPGDHTIWAGISKMYEIREITADWDIWKAFSLPRKSHEKGQIAHAAICGPLVLSSGDANGCLYPVIVPTTNSVILGAVAGQIHSCPVMRDGKWKVCGDSVSFQPVWALPSNPYHSDKSTVKILSMGEGQFPQRALNLRKASPDRLSRVQAWSDLILAACRKGLRVEPDTATSRHLWSMYRQQAKMIWRESRWT